MVSRRPATVDFQRRSSHESGEDLCQQVAHYLLLVRLTPNQLTFGGVLVCIASGVIAALDGSLAAVGLVFAVGSTFDALDGLAARTRGTAGSAFGGFADTVADKVGEVALLVGLALRISEPHVLRLIAVVGFLGLLTSFTKAAAGEYGLRARWPHAKLYGRAIRVLILSTGLIACGVVSGGEAWLGVPLSMLAFFNAGTFTARLRNVAMVRRLEVRETASNNALQPTAAGAMMTPPRLKPKR